MWRPPGTLKLREPLLVVWAAPSLSSNQYELLFHSSTRAPTSGVTVPWSLHSHCPLTSKFTSALALAGPTAASATRPSRAPTRTRRAGAKDMRRTAIFRSRFTLRLLFADKGYGLRRGGLASSTPRPDSRRQAHAALRNARTASRRPPGRTGYRRVA